MMKIIDGGVTAAEGFQAAGLAAGIKKGNTKDMAWYTARNRVWQQELSRLMW